MTEVLKMKEYTIYVYAIGGYCVYKEGEQKRVFYADTFWECVKYAEENAYNKR